MARWPVVGKTATILGRLSGAGTGKWAILPICSWHLETSTGHIVGILKACRCLALTGGIDRHIIATRLGG